MHGPEVVVILGALGAPGAKGCQLGGFDKAQVLAKMQTHLRLPLPDQAFGGHHQHPSHHAAQFQLAQDQASLDGLAQAHLVRQQVANAVAAHGPVQRVQLVGQWHHTGLDRGQQQVVFQGIQQLCGCRRMQDLLNRRAHRCQIIEILGAGTYHCVPGR